MKITLDLIQKQIDFIDNEKRYWMSIQNDVSLESKRFMSKRWITKRKKDDGINIFNAKIEYCEKQVNHCRELYRLLLEFRTRLVNRRR